MKIYTLDDMRDVMVNTVCIKRYTLKFMRWYELRWKMSWLMQWC